MDTLQYQPKPDQQLQIVMARLYLPLTREFTEKTVVNDSEKHDTNNLQIKNENFNVTSTKKEPLDADDQSAELTSNYNCQTKDTNLNTENIEIVQPLIEEVNIKQEICVDEDCSTKYLDEQAFITTYNCQIKDSNLNTENIELVQPLIEEVNIKQELIDEDFSTDYLDEQLKTKDQFCHLTSNGNVRLLTTYNCGSKETNSTTENIEIVAPLTEAVNIKREIFVDEDCSTNYLDEQLNTQDQSCQLTTNENDACFIKPSCQLEEKNVKTEDIEIVDHLLEETNIKQEPIVDDYLIANYSDDEEESMESEDLGSMSCNSGCNNERTNEESHKKLYKCKECPKAFRYPCELKGHNRVHTGDRPFKCQICQKAFTLGIHLTAHNLTHTGVKPYGCDICQKSFNRKGNLLEHKRSHNNVRPYKCSVCKKTFTRPYHLTTHMFIHSGEKPFQCSICQYKCTQSGDLKKHMRIHTEEKSFTCKHCPTSYSYQSHLKRHIKIHHIGEDN